MSFERMSSSLLEVARQRIHNGDFSERSLARFLGISQPHTHNVLKGVRPMTAELFDIMLKRLGLDCLDLYPTAEIDLHLARRAASRGARGSL